MVRCSIFHPTFHQAVLYPYSMQMVFYIQQSTLVFMTLLLPCISWYIAESGVLEFQNTERRLRNRCLLILEGGGMFSLFLYLMCWENHKKYVFPCVTFIGLASWSWTSERICHLRYYLFLTSETEEHAYKNISFKDNVTIV